MATDEYEFFASCLAGFEPTLADELRRIGARRIRPLGGGVSFAGRAVDGERVCLWSRVASRVTMVVGRVNAGDASLLYAGAVALPWENVVASGASIAVRAHGTNAELRNTQFTAVKVKDAVCDRMREQTGERPNVDAHGADLLIDVRVRNTRATLSVDVSGEALHKRTYLDARDGDDAPLAVAKAAGLLAASGAYGRLAAGWGVVDPVCDEGFLVCEAAGMAADQAPGLLRERWGFYGWAAHDEDAWSDELAAADDRFEAGVARLLALRAGATASDAPDLEFTRIVGVSASSPLVARARGHVRNAGLRAVASVESEATADAASVTTRVAQVTAKCARANDGRRAAVGNCGAEDVQAAEACYTAAVDFSGEIKATAVVVGSDEASAALPEVASDFSQASSASTLCGSGLSDRTLEDGAVGTSEASATSDDASVVFCTGKAAAGDVGAAGDAAVSAGIAADVRPALLVATVISPDRADDARAVSEEGAFAAAARCAPTGSVFAALGLQNACALFGKQPARVYAVGAGRIESEAVFYDEPPCERVSLRVPDSAGGADHTVEVYDERAEQFAARLRKVARERRKWARRAGVSCYRVYDADLTDYAVAVDVYEGATDAEGITYVHVAEYQAPSSVDPALALMRFRDVLALVPVVLGVRPDHVFSKVRERSKGGGQYARPERRSYVTHTSEAGLVFEIDLGSYLDTGIFLDHRDTRALVGSMARGKRFLNLFAYTGTASVHAAAGGARETTTVDLSQTYLDWARRNMEANGFVGRAHVFERADVMEWIRASRRAGKTYDLVFVDPPTFSNSKAMGKRTWDVQRDHVELLIGVSRLLAKGGAAVFSCNLRTFKPNVEELTRYNVELEDITSRTIPHDFERNPRIHKCYLVRRSR